MKRETVFSNDRVYRFTLWRDWSAEMYGIGGVFFTPDPHVDYYPGKKETFVQFIGLNPSVADEVKNDRTISRLIKWAKNWGFGAMCMTNVYAFVSTDRKFMKKQLHPIGQDNDRYLFDVATEAGLVVCCWGRDGAGRGQVVADMLGARGIKLHCFRELADGVPEHPLYLPKTLAPKIWKG